MDQIKLTSGKLLNVYGNLNQAGYATSLVKEYSRQDIKARKLRIKEWDYYYIGNQDYGIALTIDDNSYMGLGSVSVLDFKNDFWNTKSVMTFMPRGKTNMPEYITLVRDKIQEWRDDVDVESVTTRNARSLFKI